MKMRIFSAIAILAITIVIAFNVNLNLQNSNSVFTLSSVEGLANENENTKTLKRVAVTDHCSDGTTCQSIDCVVGATDCTIYHCCGH